MTEAARSRSAVPYEALDDIASSYFAAGEADGGHLVDDYRIAGEYVRLEYASRALRDRLRRAFAHLVHPAGLAEPALTVRLWDSASTGAPPPPRPEVPQDYAPGALFHVDEPPIRAAYQPGLEALSILDAEAGTAWHWVASAYDQPYWDQASPIRQILHWWLRSQDYLQVHGASVGTPVGGVLIVGKAGSGKSTVALSTLGSDLLYAGDDYVAIRPGGDPCVQSLYNSGKLEPSHILGPFQHLVPLLANGDRLADEKAVIYVHEHYPEQTTEGFPLRAVLVPTITDRAQPRFGKASRADAFSALAPSTIFQLHTAGPDALRSMSALVGSVPTYALELGSDVQAIPDALSNFLADLEPGSR